MKDSVFSQTSSPSAAANIDSPKIVTTPLIIDQKITVPPFIINSKKNDPTRIS